MTLDDGQSIADLFVASAQLELTGTPEVRPARLHRVDPTSAVPTSDPTAPSPQQRLSLTGPGVAVIEAPGG